MRTDNKTLAERLRHHVAHGHIDRVFDDELLEAADRLDEQAWISVKDRLPEDNQDCIVAKRGDIYCKDGVMFGQFDQGYQGRWRFENDCGTIDCITHWMPMPKPPEVKS